MVALTLPKTINLFKVSPQTCLSVDINIHSMFLDYHIDRIVYIINTHYILLLLVIKGFDGVFHIPDHTHYVCCIGDFP